MRDAADPRSPPPAAAAARAAGPGPAPGASFRWIHVFGPGGSLGRAASREVVNTALLSLGRPGLDG